MKFLELVAHRTGMHEVMLTVQLQNGDALRMYRNLGYEDHWDQPEVTAVTVTIIIGDLVFFFGLCPMAILLDS